MARLNRDEAAFLAAYPNASKGVANLIQAIRQRNGRRRISRNGTPDERDSRATPMPSGADSRLPEEVGTTLGPSRSAQLHPNHVGAFPFFLSFNMLT